MIIDGRLANAMVKRCTIDTCAIVKVRLDTGNFIGCHLVTLTSTINATKRNNPRHAREALWHIALYFCEELQEHQTIL